MQPPRSRHSLYKHWMVITKSCSAFSLMPECGVFPDGTFFDKELPMLIISNSGRETLEAKAVGPSQQHSQAGNLERHMDTLNQLEMCCLSLVSMATWSLFQSLWFSPSHSPFSFHCCLVILCCPSLLIFSCRMIGIFFYFFPGSQFFLLLTALPSLSEDCIISDVPCRSLICHHALSSLCTLSFIPCLLKLKKPNHRYAKKLTIIASYYFFLFVFL